MLDSFRDKIDGYKELIEIMLLHYKNIYNVNAKNLNILYDSSYFISEFKTHIEIMIQYLLIFLMHTTRKYSLNYFLIHLINILKNIKERYIKKLEDFIINISQQETKELLKIDINNFEQNKVFYSQKNIQISPDFKAKKK